jgi:hypothetical protein
VIVTAGSSNTWTLALVVRTSALNIFEKSAPVVRWWVCAVLRRFQAQSQREEGRGELAQGSEGPKRRDLQLTRGYDDTGRQRLEHLVGHSLCRTGTCSPAPC